MINEKYSYANLSGQDFTKVDAKEFNNSEIVGSGFAFRDWSKDNNVFPPTMTGVTFTACNLDNVIIPPGNIIGEKTCNVRYMVQADGEDWLVDVDGIPYEPFKLERLIKAGKNTDPSKIPTDFIYEQHISQDYWDKTYANDEIPAESLYMEVPEIIETNGKTLTISGKAYLDIKFKQDVLSHLMGGG